MVNDQMPPMPKKPGDAMRLTMDANISGYEYRTLMIILPCGHMAILDHTYTIRDLDTDQPSAKQPLVCVGDYGLCWKGFLKKGELQAISIN